MMAPSTHRGGRCNCNVQLQVKLKALWLSIQSSETRTVNNAITLHRKRIRHLGPPPCNGLAISPGSEAFAVWVLGDRQVTALSGLLSVGPGRQTSPSPKLVRCVIPSVFQISAPPSRVRLGLSTTMSCERYSSSRLVLVRLELRVAYATCDDDHETRLDRQSPNCRAEMCGQTT